MGLKEPNARTKLDNEAFMNVCPNHFKHWGRGNQILDDTLCAPLLDCSFSSVTAAKLLWATDLVSTPIIIADFNGLNLYACHDNGKTTATINIHRSQ